jgi:hypothetical protein
MLTTGHPLAASTKGQAAFQLPFAVNVIVYAAIVIVCLAVLGAVLLHTRRTVADGRPLAADRRWRTQDILVVAIMSVLLEVYDNLIGDQLVTPLVQGIPYAHNLAVNDLPYMFLLMIGIAVIRKPGAATAMVFLNFLLMQLLYGGSESSPLYWPYGLLQGVFLDLYILYRRGRVFSSAGVPAVVDGLILGALRAFPATAAQAAVITPLLSGITKTGGAIVVYAVLNTIGNSIEAGITAPLAVRVARTVRPDAGYTDDDILEPANDTSSQRPQKERER